MNYDSNNIFARILRGEIPCEKAYENDSVLAIYDIHPQAPLHILILPKSHHISIHDFCKNASPADQAGFWKAIGDIAEELGIYKTGYRLITNHGQDAGQEVPHFHVHLLAGESIGPLRTHD